MKRLLMQPGLAQRRSLMGAVASVWGHAWAPGALRAAGLSPSPLGSTLFLAALFVWEILTASAGTHPAQLRSHLQLFLGS